MKTRIYVTPAVKGLKQWPWSPAQALLQCRQALVLWAQKLKSEIIQLLQSLFPQTGDMQVNFSEVSLKFKMTAKNELHNFLLALNSKM